MQPAQLSLHVEDVTGFIVAGTDSRSLRVRSSKNLMRQR